MKKHDLSYSPLSQSEEDTSSDEEFVEVVGRSRVWRSLLVGTIVVALLVAGAIAAVILTRSPESHFLPTSAALTASPSKGGILLEEFLNGTFSPDVFNGSWISDKEFMYQTIDGAVNLFNAETLRIQELISSEVMDEWRPSKYSLSPSRKYMMFVHDVQKLFRYSYLARHTVYDLKTGETIPLAPQRVKGRQDQPPLLYVTWAPTSDAIAFVFHNDLYYATSPKLSTLYRLTDTGRIGEIFNGIPDWVYEEEILSSNVALWLSPDGSQLAFATFNDTRVDSMNFPLYGRPGDLNFQYPIQQSVKYPKPGRENPTVDIWVVDLAKLVSGSSDTVRRMAPPSSLNNEDHYFTVVSWATPDKLAIIWMNRHQNKSIIGICSRDGDCQDDLVHRSLDHAWNDLYAAPMFDTTGAPAGLPGQRHLYYVEDLNSKNPKQAYCITCGFKNDYGEDCNYNTAELSEKSGYYALTCGGPGIPQVTIHDASDHSRKILLEDNHEIRESLQDRPLPVEKRLEIDIQGGFKAQVSMKMPPDYIPGNSKKYPMLIYVYGGPGSQVVSDRFRIEWGDYLASERGIIYTSIDARGSGYSGDKLLHALYRALGTFEVDDQIAVTAALQQSFPEIDSSRTGIWGWSYGGYVAAAALSRDKKDVFKCGISVAPVTSWIYYDTVYTERYMGLPTPEDNFLAYEASDVTKNVENFRNKKFFLIHGTADDNVHYQQSMMLSRVLEVEDILFRSQSYPDENHGLAGVKEHHYHSMEEFLNECFNLV